MATDSLLWAHQPLRVLVNDLELLCESSGLPVARQLADIAQNMTSNMLRCDELEDLIRVSHDEMTRAHSRHESTYEWRRIYTDACILQSLAEVLGITPGQPLQETSGISCISRLDRAIIIAGPCGDGRLELILNVISKIQSCTLWTKNSMPAFSSELFANSLHQMQLSTASYSRSIRRIDARTLPSLSTFTSTLCKEPFILSNFIKDWPAMQEHPWRSLEYLRSIAGPGRVVPVEVGSDYRADDWTQSLMNFDAFLASLAEPDSPGVRKPVLYLAQHDLFKQFPALRDDIIIPDYAYAAPDAPENYPDYRPPTNDEQLVINAWLGPSGTVSPAHTDPFFNLYAQVVGRKTVWLSSLDTTPYMYSYRNAEATILDLAEEGKPSSSHPNPAANNVEPTMSNTSRVDVFAPDEARFPMFTEHVAPNALGALLEPGDLLYFPPGWWHAMQSEETSFSVSMWF